MSQSGKLGPEAAVASIPAEPLRQAKWRGLVERAGAALSLLFDAHEWADELQRSTWDFAVEIDALRSAGMTTTMLRCLVCEGYVEHGRELAAYTDEVRTFQRSSGLRFARDTCFVLTQTGVAFVRAVLAEPAQPPDAAVAQGNGRDHEPDRATKPIWDCERQELRAGDLVVKQFKVPAANQQTILAAFEEEGWPPHIDDPLPPHFDQDPKRRLHDTITSLNRNQRQFLVRFSGDGTGEGIRWEFTRSPASDSPHRRDRSKSGSEIGRAR